MNRLEFMKKLRALLMDVEEGEREEALSYYENYFDDAGVENEQQVIRSLGTPEKVAKMIKEGLNDTAWEKGEFTENGYSGYGENKKEEVGYPGTANKIGKNRGTGGWILLLILAIFALPILGPVVMGAVSVLFAILATGASLLFALIILGIVFLVVGAVAFAAAFRDLFVTPAIGIILFGVSLLFFGFGVLAITLGICVVTKVLPKVIRWIVRIFGRLFKKKEA